MCVCRSTCPLDTLVEADTRIDLSIVHSQAVSSISVAQGIDVFMSPVTNSEHYANTSVYMQQQSGKVRKIMDIKDVAEKVQARGLNPCALPLLHVQTDCDSTSFLYGIGKANCCENIP